MSIICFPDTKYTALIPMDNAFQSWYPIDWGFNPFDVKSFSRKTILDHFLVGEVDQETVANGAEFKTVGGRTVRFTRVASPRPGRTGLQANGVDLVEGGTDVAHGTLLFVDSLLFVDIDQVNRLNEQHKYLVSGSPMTGWEDEIPTTSYSTDHAYSIFRNPDLCFPRRGTAPSFFRTRTACST